MSVEKQKDLPKGWVETTIGDLSNQINGKAFKPKDWSDVGLPIIRIQNLNGLNDNYNYCNTEVEGKFHVKNGDLLFAWSGTPGTSFGAHIWKGEDAVLNQHIFNIKIYNEEIVDRRYYYYSLNKLVSEFISKAQGTAGLAHITKKEFESTKVSLPPLAEQKRIVAKLDAFMEQIAEAKKGLQSLPQLLKDFRQSVLSQAVTGKLTQEWREGKDLGDIDLNIIEITRENKKRELALKRGRKTYNHKKAVLPDIGGFSKGLESKFDLPSSWKWVSLDQVTWNISDGPHYSPKYVEESEGKRFISMRNISFNKLNFEDCKYVSLNDHEEFINRGKPEKGDILYTKGGTTGIPCLVGDDNDFSYWVHVALLKLIDIAINSAFLMNMLASDLCYKQSQALTHGVGNQDLGLTRMIYISFPLPPLEEQKEIVRRVEALFLQADTIESQYKTLKEKVETLPQAILAKAFRGELVAQDSADEPASVLLAKITALRESLGGKKKK